MLKVRNMVSARSGREVSNQFIITEVCDYTGEVLRETFQSYDSMIACVDHEHDKILIGKNWDYSVTTAKYRNQFFGNQYGISALSVKGNLQNALANGVFMQPSGRVWEVVKA